MAKEIIGGSADETHSTARTDRPSPERAHLPSVSGALGPDVIDSSKKFDDLSVGAVLAGKYRIQGLLGGGAAGRVYRAIQEPIGRQVAVKVLRPDLPPKHRQIFEARFMREAALTGSLQHANIVTVHDFGRSAEGYFYIVMEYVPGESLRDEMSTGPMDPARVLDVFIGIVRGLQAAHDKGMVHRDVKPANVVISPAVKGSGGVKLLDFGLVKDLDQTGVTAVGTMMGTPRYMPPEQARGQAADHRSDLYSVGVMMYQGLTAEAPFQARGAMAMALCHIKDPYPPMATRAPLVPVHASIEAIVYKCMRKAREDRYQTAQELLDDLVDVRRSGQFHDVGDISIGRARPPVVPSQSMATGTMALLLAVPVLLALVVGIAVGRGLGPAGGAPAAVAPAVQAVPATVDEVEAPPTRHSKRRRARRDANAGPPPTDLDDAPATTDTDPEVPVRTSHREGFGEVPDVEPPPLQE